jgi:long-subunit fatty acid transport protein
MRKTPLLLLCLLLSCTARGGNNDFGLDISAGAEKKLMYGRLTLGLDADFRTQSNTSRVERYALEASASYKLVDRRKFGLKARFSYEHIWSQKLGECESTYKDKYEDDKFDYVGNGQFAPILKGYNVGYNYTAAYWRMRSRLNAAIAFSYKPTKRWSFSLRETVQYSHYYSTTADRTKYREKVRYGEETTYTTEQLVKDKVSKNHFLLRSKLTIEYDIRRCPLTPFASVDYGTGLGYNAQKWKISAGTSLKLNYQNSMKVYYRFQTENDDDEPNGHLLGIGYEYKF